MNKEFNLKDLLVIQDEEKMLEIGERIHKILKAKGMKHRELARKMGMGDSDFSMRINATRLFKKSEIEFIMKELGVTKECLLYGEMPREDFDIEILDEEIFKPKTRMEKVLLAKLNEVIEYLRVKR